MTNSGIASLLHVLDRLGLDAEKLQTLLKWVVDDKNTVTLSFRAQDGCSFIKETQVDHVVSPGWQYESTETTQGNETSHKKARVVKKVKQYHWKIDISYVIAVYPGTDSSSAIELQSRNTSSVIVTSAGMANDYIPKTTTPPVDKHTLHSPIEINITWLLMTLNRETGVCQFAVDRTIPSCQTPRRNEQVDSALEFQASLKQWANGVIGFFMVRVEKDILAKNNPLQTDDGVSETSLMQGTQQEDAIYKPIVPLMENGSVLSEADTGALLEAHSQSMDQSLNGLSQVFPPSQLLKLVTLSEASILLLCRHLLYLINQYQNSIDYVEGMLKRQLIQAIGKEVNSRDFDKFMRFHNQKLFASAYTPRPFTYAIRRKNHYPDGILSIEPRNNGAGNEKMDSVETMVRHVSGANNPPIFIPLNSATSVEITGDRYLHGWIQHRFESEAQSVYQLVARARQFSYFLLVVGNMAGKNKFSPKAAIILQNKDEVLIPLLTEVLPTAKEFKDAIASLSPEQQAFAKAYRGMQLESSVFGICVIQLKPQLEKLLGLPVGALTKEIKLTQDLMSLFVDYQIPSDLLSFGGDDAASMEGKLEAVKGHVKAVMDVISAAKENQIMEEERKAEMREAKDLLVRQEQEVQLLLKLQQHQQQQQRQQQQMPVFDSPQRYCLSPFPCAAPTTSTRSSRPAAFAASLPSASVAASFPYAAKEASFPSASVAASFPSASGAASLPSASGAASFPSASGAASLPSASGAASLPSASGAESFPSASAAASLPSASAAASLPSASLGVSEWKSLEGSVVPAAAAASSQIPDGKSGEANISQDTQSPEEPIEADDFTLVPKVLDAKVEKFDANSSLKSTILKTGPVWERLRQEDLLSDPKSSRLFADDVRSEKNKAFDLLDALSRSGTLSIECAELHVVVAVSHCFENDLMGTIIQDNINPIDKVERSSLIVGSTIHDETCQVLLQSSAHIGRIGETFPALFAEEE